MASFLRRHRFCPHALREVLHFPRLARPFHPLARKHTIAVSLGAAIMFIAAAASRVELHFLPLWLWEGTLWCIHGFGAYPIMQHVEPLWKLLTAPTPPLT